VKAAIMSIVAIVCVPVVIVAAIVLFAGKPTSSPTACGIGTGGTPDLAGDVPKKIGRWDGDQLAVASQLVAVAREMKVNSQATAILVMTAMGESSLSNPDHGDAVDNSTIGVLQQGTSYGSRPERFDIPTAARAFLTRLVALPGWEEMEPTLAAHKVQINADPYHYAPFFAEAQEVVSGLTGEPTTSGCDVSGDEVQLATILANAWEEGTLTDPYHPQMVEQQILPIVDGTVQPGCKVDPRVLQLLVAALNKYGSVQISDLNRPCVGLSINCPISRHCKNPAMAVDFNAVGGKPLLGSGPANTEFLTWLDTVLPPGSQAGQGQCPARPVLANIAQFTDPCTHQHIDLGTTTAPLTLTGK
jgi:hypothetical protein